MRIRELFLLLLIVSFSLVVGYWAIPLTVIPYVLQDAGYYIIFLVFVSFCVAGLSLLIASRNRNWPQSLKELIFRHRWALILILILNFWAQVAETTEYKVLGDEPALVGTSLSMHKIREPIVPVRAFNIEGVLHITDGYVDKRPFLFPFVLSLIHDATGYRVANAFVLNAVLGLVCSFLVYATGAVLIDRKTGLLAVFLVFSVPLFVQSLNGAGFELLNLVMILALFLSALAYYQAPDARKLTFLSMSGVMLCNVRYESVLYLVPVAIVVLLTWLRQRRVDLSWGAYVAPLLLIPVLLHRRIFQSNPQFWELYSKNADTPFSIDYLGSNVGHFTNFFFGPSMNLPSSIAVSILGTLGLLFFLAQILSKPSRIRTMCPSSIVWLVFLIGFYLNTYLLLVYFFGQVDAHIIRRLTLPLYLALAVMAAWFIMSFQNPKWRSAIVMISVAFFCLRTVPKVSSATHNDTYFPIHEYHFVHDFMERHDEEFVIMTRFPVIWINEGISAFPLARSEDSLRKLGGFLSFEGTPPVYLYDVINLNPVTGDFYVGPRWAASPMIEIEPIERSYFSQLQQLRVSKVVDVEIEEPDYKSEDGFYRQFVRNLP